MNKKIEFLDFNDVAIEKIDEIYLDLLKRCITRALVGTPYARHTISPTRPLYRTLANTLRNVLQPFGLELVKRVPSGVDAYLESTHSAHSRMEDAESMLGLKQFDQMQACVRDILQRGVPGDLLEAGVWRGGMTIFMRALLQAAGSSDRSVWVVDSFEGLPVHDSAEDSFGWDSGDMNVSLDDVKRNFARYRMLDSQVRFVKGFFCDSLPKAEIGPLAVLRVDADLYGSTKDVLENLYPKLSPGGYAIFDDYQNLADCRRAVDDYRQKHAIVEQIIPIDKRAVYWIKEKD